MVIALAAAVAFTWLGMLLGVSFLEAPLKFRAPGVTPQLGLGIGRVVFAALNRVEVLLTVVLALTVVAGPSVPLVTFPAALVGTGVGALGAL